MGWDGMGEPGRVSHKHLHLSHTRSVSPSHFFLLPRVLPAKRAAGLRGQPTAPPPSSSAGRSPFPASGCGPKLGPRLASQTPVSDSPRVSQPNSRAPPPPAPGAPINVPFIPQDAPCPASSARSRLGHGRRSFPRLPPRSRLVSTWRDPRPRPVSPASDRLPSPPSPAPFPGGYSLKPLRISLARSSLADMMRRPPPAALPRWPGGASQTVSRSLGWSRSPAWRPRASSGSGQTKTGLSLPSAPAPDLFSFPEPRSARPETNGKPASPIGILTSQ